MNAELIRFARRHRYEIAEGFCLEGEEAREWKTMMNASLKKLSPRRMEWLELLAEELSARAGVTLHEAQSALLNWILKRYLDGYRVRRNN